MYFNKIEELHHHTFKPTFVKIIFATFLSIILLFLLQPIWLFKIDVDQKVSYTNKDRKLCIKKDVNWYLTFFITLFFIIFIYNLL
jgi:hypothetical protein